jgi:ketopantoate reductase
MLLRYGVVTFQQTVASTDQNRLQGNFMEIEAIVGEPVREGRRLGIPTPKLETVYGLLKAKQLQVKEQKGLWEARFGADAKYT